jgi:hypothetical protein
VSAPKVANVVCAQNLFKRKGAKPILQATVPFIVAEELFISLKVSRCCCHTKFIIVNVEVALSA